VFEALTLHGGTAAILWGYHTAVSLRAWKIAKVDNQWTLVATIERLDAFQARQTPLLFTTPRKGAHDGFWAWGVESISVGTHHLTARLGPPEQ
jgi:hypothetical protein